MSTLGVFYTCYKEGIAVEKSIATHYKYHPDCKVYLVSEGDDFSHLEMKFPNLKANLVEDISTWPVKCVNASNFRNVDIQDRIKTYFHAILGRIEDATNFCNTTHILHSQPDVILRGRLTIPDDAKLLQPFVNVYDERRGGLKELLRQTPGAVDFNYWGFPQIHSSNVFNEMLKLIRGNPEVLNSIITADCAIHHSDMFMPFLFALTGYTSTHNPEVVECLREPNWRSTNHPLVHQCRELYPKIDYDGFHAT